jgi:hypothetical protein
MPMDLDTDARPILPPEIQRQVNRGKRIRPILFKAHDDTHEMARSLRLHDERMELPHYQALWRDAMEAAGYRVHEEVAR